MLNVKILKNFFVKRGLALVNKEKFMEISYVIFNKFYYTLLSNNDTSKYFTSFEILNNLIKRQSEVLYNVFELIEKSDYKKAFDILYEVAKMHHKLGIDKTALFSSIDLYIYLLEEYKEELKISKTMIDNLKDLLQATTAKVYIENTLQDIYKFLKSLDYKIAFEVAEKVELLQKAVESFYRDHKVGVYLESHTICSVAKMLRSLAFDVMCYGKEDKKREMLMTHKLIHDNMNDVLSSLESKDFLKAVSYTRDFINNITKFLYDYEKIYTDWNNHKDDIIAKILTDKHQKDKYGVILIHRFREAKFDEKVSKEIENLLSKFLEDNVFYVWIDDYKELILFMDKRDSNFQNLLNRILEELEDLAQKIPNTYLFTGGSIFAIIKIDPEFFADYGAEELKEAINAITDQLLTGSKNDSKLIIVKDLREDFEELLKIARENLKIKKLVIEKVLNKDIDIFVQWIYDLNLNKKYVEILVRVKGKNNEYIPAYKFIKVLEKEKMMDKLDEAMFIKLAENIDKIKKLTNKISVNIYPDSLNSDIVIDALKKLADVCNKNGVELNIEITEYAIVTNREIFEYIKDSKVYLVIDDFGAGYTNFELIGSLKEKDLVKALKIDGSIVKRLIESKLYENIATTISQFAKATELDLVYEFVDNEEIINKIKEISEETKMPYDRVYLQGFYLHKPSPLEEELKVK
ncbi:putative eal/pas/ggdef domain protein [Sulfurihydrogenibium yellowstonense SS-5]|uniref:Putative eal/pas/ggdef domain protein n=1 Tax=Sulfurihydrogenibium yellowstonense SS-5 TaxID=432331 RepID=C4FKK5_9AQUI|nr:putative eal/pas/ggdef domain protein [Sulfurihydrogenibium yellowstonense SS-5]